MTDSHPHIKEALMAAASYDEYIDHFRSTTFETYDFRVYDETDNGEFITTATVDLIERGMVIHTETFVASSEDAPGPMSAYGNGRDNHAGALARSYAWAWVDSHDETSLIPFGIEWQREREEAGS